MANVPAQRLSPTGSVRTGPRQQPRWDATQLLIQRFKDLEAATIKALRPALDEWNKRLAYCGGEPSLHNWEEFRPLRLAREEDWSDWLAYLLLRTTSGRLIRHLTGVADLGVLH